MHILYFNHSNLNKVMKTVIIGFNIAILGQTLVYGITFIQLTYFVKNTSKKLDWFWVASQIDD